LTKVESELGTRNSASPLAKEYVVLHSEPKSAKIFQDNVEKALLRKMDGRGIFELSEAGGRQDWTISGRVDGEFRPFSIDCFSKNSGKLILQIRDHLFSHKSEFYSIGGALPEGTLPRDVLAGSKFICRLVNFPFSRIEDVDPETKHRMKRYRGIAVVEIGGLGADGYRAKFHGDELEDVELPLTASTYLLYTTR
jgi:hypothetical protein